MELYFGKTTETDETYEQDSKNYYYLLVSDEDGVVLHDSCNRALPFAIEEVPALITALNVYMKEEGALNLLIEALQDSKEEYIITVD